jgi:hypothetical protein
MRKAMTAVFAVLLATFACSQKPPVLKLKAAERALNAWLNDQAASFLKSLGQGVPELDNSAAIIGPAASNEASNPGERIFSVSLGFQPVMVKTKNSNEFISIQGQGTARFIWDRDAWYLAHIQADSGVSVEDIHWKVEDR